MPGPQFQSSSNSTSIQTFLLTSLIQDIFDARHIKPHHCRQSLLNEVGITRNGPFPPREFCPTNLDFGTRTPWWGMGGGADPSTRFVILSFGYHRLAMRGRQWCRAASTPHFSSARLILCRRTLIWESLYEDDVGQMSNDFQCRTVHCNLHQLLADGCLKDRSVGRTYSPDIPNGVVNILPFLDRHHRRSPSDTPRHRRSRCDTMATNATRS